MKLKNLTKKLTTLAITALMATTLVSTQNVLAASKKAQKKANKAYAQAIKKNKVAKFTSYSLIGRKADLLIRRKISLLHIRIDLVPAFSLFEQLHRNLGRPDSRERSPRQILTGRIRQKLIQILFQPVLRLRAV